MPLSETLLEPIAGDNPGGTSVRYEPVYDQIKQARHEEIDVPQGEWQRPRKVADYALVIKLATEVLAKRSKDLQVAAWLTEALLRRQGYPGLLDGLTLIHGLIEKFWDHLYPEIEDGDLGMRAAPLEWVGQYLETAAKMVPLNRAGHDFLRYKESRLVGYEAQVEGDSEREAARNEQLEQGRLAPEEFDSSFEETPKAFYKQLLADIDAASAARAALEKLCDEKFADEAPAWSNLRDGLAEVRQLVSQLLAKKLETDPDPIEAEPVPTMDVTGAAGAPAGDGGGGTVSLEPRSREDAAARVAAAARFLRQAAPTDPAPYLMLRGFRWGELRVQGSEVDPRVLAAPPTEIRTRLKGLMLDARWPQLLEASEEVMATPFGRGWLDLQRYVFTACEALGSEYQFVLSAIRGALRSLLRDIPQLPDLTLMDDSPTANAETRRWLRESGLAEELAEPEPGFAAPRPTAPAAGGMPRHGAVDRARERLRAGQTDKAIELLLHAAAQEKSDRARFLLRSEATRIMVESGHESVARPLLEDMMQQIEKHTLEEWEDGETVALPLGLLYRCLVSLDGDESLRDSLYERVCRLDPMRAMQLNSVAAAHVEPES